MADNYLLPGTSFAFSKTFISDNIGVRKFFLKTTSTSHDHAPKYCEMQLTYCRTKQGVFHEKADIEITVNIPMSMNWIKE